MAEYTLDEVMKEAPRRPREFSLAEVAEAPAPQPQPQQRQAPAQPQAPQAPPSATPRPREFSIADVAPAEFTLADVGPRQVPSTLGTVLSNPVEAIKTQASNLVDAYLPGPLRQPAPTTPDEPFRSFATFSPDDVFAIQRHNAAVDAMERYELERAAYEAARMRPRDPQVPGSVLSVPDLGPGPEPVLPAWARSDFQPSRFGYGRTQVDFISDKADVSTSDFLQAGLPFASTRVAGAVGQQVANRVGPMSGKVAAGLTHAIGGAAETTARLRVDDVGPVQAIGEGIQQGANVATSIAKAPIAPFTDKVDLTSDDYLNLAFATLSGLMSKANLPRDAQAFRAARADLQSAMRGSTDGQLAALRSRAQQAKNLTTVARRDLTGLIDAEVKGRTAGRQGVRATVRPEAGRTTTQAQPQQPQPAPQLPAALQRPPAPAPAPQPTPPPVAPPLPAALQRPTAPVPQAPPAPTPTPPTQPKAPAKPASPEQFTTRGEQGEFTYTDPKIAKAEADRVNKSRRAAGQPEVELIELPKGMGLSFITDPLATPSAPQPKAPAPAARPREFTIEQVQAEPQQPRQAPQSPPQAPRGAEAAPTPRTPQTATPPAPVARQPAFDRTSARGSTLSPASSMHPDMKAMLERSGMDEQELAGFMEPDVLQTPQGQPPRTGEAVTVEGFRGSGRAEHGSAYAEGATGAVLGDARYYAINQKDAQTFGPNVERSTVRLNNPLVIDSDRMLARWMVGSTDAAVPRDNATRAKLIEGFRRRVEQAGHDGVIVNVPQQADMNPAGDSVKRMREVFGTTQVVEFGEGTAPASAPAAPTPPAQPTQAKQVRLPEQFTKAAIERQLIEAGRGLPDVSEQITARLAGTELEGASPFRFSGRVPTEVRDHYERQTHMLTRFKGNDPRGRGEDLLAELGDDTFFALADSLVTEQGRAGQLRQAKARLRGAEEVDPQGAFLAHLHDRIIEAGTDRKPMEVIDPNTLDIGTTFKVQGEEFEVVSDEFGGGKLLENGVTVPAEAFSEMPVDVGSVQKAKPQTVAARTSGQQQGLPGVGPEGAFDGPTVGSRTGDMFGPEPGKSAADRADDAFRESQTPKDSETAEMFPEAEPIPDDLMGKSARELQRMARDLGVKNPPTAKADLIETIQQRTAAKRDLRAQVSEDGPTIDRHQAGFARVGAVMEVAEAITSAPIGAAQVGKALLDKWSKPLTRVVEDQGGATGKTLANLSRKASDESRRIMGMLQPRMLRVQRAASGSSPASLRASRSLASIEWDSSQAYGFTRFQKAVEGRIPDSQLSPLERTIVEGYRGLVRHSGLMAQRKGVQIRDHRTGKYRPFVASDEGKVMLRRATPELWAILEDGPSSAAFNRLADVLADANGVSQKVALRQLVEMREQAIIKRAAFEVSRVLENFPTHMRVGKGVNSSVVPLLHSEPFEAASALVRSAALRLGYIDAFGQDVPTGKGPTLSERLVEQFVRQGGSRASVEDLIRALNGIPLRRIYTKPGTPMHEAARTGNFLMSMVKTGLLTRSALPNIPESLGNTQAFAGIGRYFRAWQQLALHPRSMAIETARHGARTVEVVRLTVDPRRKREGFARLARDLGLRITGAIPVNEINEMHAAVSGLLMANDLKAGRGTVLDRVRLEIMGFTPEQITDLMGGHASRDLYSAVVARMAEVTQGSTSLPAERSIAAHSRLYKTLVAFDSYIQMKTDRTGRVNRAFFDAMREAKSDPKKAIAASHVAAQYYFGTAASGAAAYFLRALAVGGVSGLAIAAYQAENDKGQFAWEGLKYALLGGPTEALWRTVGEKQQRWYEPLMEFSLPVSLMQDVYDMTQDQGRYKDRTWTEKSAAFLKNHVTISGPVATWAATMGLGEKNNQLDASVRAYWKWRYENVRPGSFSPGEMTAEHAEFRRHMRRALEAIKADGDPQPHITKALGVEGKGARNVKASIRARRLLNELTAEQRESFRQSVPDWTYAEIEAYDATLEAWADRVSDGGK